MNRKSFMAELKSLLAFMDEEDRSCVLQRYEAMFDAAGPEGEEALLASFGSPVRQVLKIERQYREELRQEAAAGKTHETLIAPVPAAAAAPAAEIVSAEPELPEDEAPMVGFPEEEEAPAVEYSAEEAPVPAGFAAAFSAVPGAQDEAEPVAAVEAEAPAEPALPAEPAEEPIFLDEVPAAPAPAEKKNDDIFADISFADLLSATSFGAATAAAADARPAETQPAPAPIPAETATAAPVAAPVSRGLEDIPETLDFSESFLSSDELPEEGMPAGEPEQKEEFDLNALLAPAGLSAAAEPEQTESTEIPAEVPAEEPIEEELPAEVPAEEPAKEELPAEFPAEEPEAEEEFSAEDAEEQPEAEEEFSAEDAEEQPEAEETCVPREEQPEEEYKPTTGRIIGAILVSIPMIAFVLAGVAISLALGLACVLLGVGLGFAGVYIASYIFGGQTSFMPDLLLMGGGVLLAFCFAILLVWLGVFLAVGGCILTVRITASVYRGILGKKSEEEEEESDE